MGEVRYASLLKKDENKANELFDKSKKEAEAKREKLEKLRKIY